MAAPLPPSDLPLPRLPANHPAQAYASLPVRDLVVCVQQAAAGCVPAQAMYEAFYYRYYPYLWKVVANALGFLHDHGGVEEVVNDALVAFFRQSGKFRLDPALDDTGCDRVVRAYLGKLARWKAARVRQFQQSFGADALDSEALDRRLHQLAEFSLPEETEAPADEPRTGSLEPWLASLREVERDVLYTYFFDDHAGRKSSRLPVGVARRLAKKHRVTTSNIRHLKLKLQRQLREKFHLS